MSDVDSLESMENRDLEMHELIVQMEEDAKKLLAKRMLQAAGYRILVKPITIKRKLEGVQADAAPTLASKGFEAMTEKERERHERSEHHGIVMHVGPTAYERLGEPWCKQGDLVVFSRNAGTRVEHPPGSNSFFTMINDNDVFGVIV